MPILVPIQEHKELILPGSIEFEQTLATPPPGWREVANKGNGYAWVADPNQAGMLRTVDGRGCQEYLLGGEFQERLETMWSEDEDGLFCNNLEGVNELFIDW